MLILLLACSTEPEPEPEHSHHAPDLRERATKVFAPGGDTRFDRWLEGEDSLSAEEEAGLEAFLEAGCAHCHAGPDLGSSDAPSLRGSPLEPPHPHASAAHRAFLQSLR